MQVVGSLKASPEIAEILEDMFELVNDAGLPLFIETHRGTVTQDLRRTVKVIDRFKKVRFTGDFSHYALAGELTGVWSEEVWEHFRPIAARCGNWHGRISRGEQAQDDISDGRDELAQQYKKLWSIGMSAWLKNHSPATCCRSPANWGPPRTRSPIWATSFPIDGNNRWSSSVSPRRRGPTPSCHLSPPNRRPRPSKRRHRRPVPKTPPFNHVPSRRNARFYPNPLLRV